eukprot:TRINITY_DN10442_c0_g1_i1.p1 TRINITY_DN10442_c0_g1~~TRINITY_DN10442_c0_g1_i1.p1  ORF type:complete len:385 (-),score=103.14 TRINITY_DN10442_c0_g1_i1:13-1131(-)
MDDWAVATGSDHGREIRLTRDEARGFGLPESDLVDEVPSHVFRNPEEDVSPLPETRYISLQDREEIAKCAFKTWFRIAPGNKEIKDRWWSLYYRKIIPKYQLSDNHLGRQINGWIDADLKSLDGNLAVADVETDGDKKKKKKLHSAKEGAMPVYLNVELVNPSPSLLSKADPPSGSKEWYAQRLRDHCIDAKIDFDPHQLDQELLWFRQNRQSIMESIPSLTRGKQIAKRKKTTMSKQMALPPPLPLAPLAEHSSHVNNGCKVDVYQNGDDLIVRVDLPNVIPHRDFNVLVSGSRLIIRGERKPDLPDGFRYIQQHRPHGKFEVEHELPMHVDTTISEQNFSNGVLTIKFGTTKGDGWRTLEIEHLKDDFYK